jgi:hypothetical protein
MVATDGSEIGWNSRAASAFAGMRKPFSQPIPVWLGATGWRSLGSAEEAATFLTSEWPGQRDAFHRDALDACLKVLEGYRSTADAEAAVRDLVARAGMAQEQSR